MLENLDIKFTKSIFSLKDLPKDRGREVIFCGISNAGKSSVLNSLSQNKRISKTSKTPGRTQSLNLFYVHNKEEKRIIDLPGYGYAKVSKKMRNNWVTMINNYLNSRKSLMGLLIIMDIRHPFKEMDLRLIEWCGETNIPLKILLNKKDKLSNNQAVYQEKKYLKILEEINNKAEMQLYSCKKKIGQKELINTMGDWLKIESPENPG